MDGDARPGQDVHHGRPEPRARRARGWVPLLLIGISGTSARVNEGGFEMRRILATVAVLGCLIVAACAPGGEEPGTEGTDEAGGTVKIGAVFPLTGASAATGEKTLEGVELAAEIVNEDLPDLDLPLAEGKGLPNLDGATVEVVSAD